ncbi:anthrax toxin receptor-like, partial [Herpailurus yagouaroundi]|uniref:anthrax toxin receptor-like n=1 Tax=Herpailurus yagouaroundi TaxID=1608482 RepID=UPI001AD68265
MPCKTEGKQPSAPPYTQTFECCFAEDYEIMISGKGFNNAINKEEVICRFRFSDDKFFDKKATTVDDNTITCSGVMIQKPDQLVHVEVSLNNAISFIRSDANITSDNCMSARVR